MKEDNMINEQDLGKVSGGFTGSQDFEIVWGDYAGAYCGICARGKHNELSPSYDPAVCESGKAQAAAMWAADKALGCPYYMQPC